MFFLAQKWDTGKQKPTQALPSINLTEIFQLTFLKLVYTLRSQGDL